MTLAKLAITMGDPSGVGPEIIAKVLTRPEVFQLCIPIVVGDKRVLKKAHRLIGQALSALRTH